MDNLYNSFLEKDLDWIKDRLQSNNAQFIDSHILVLGGSGFIGSWLLLYFEHLNEKMGMNIEITALRRCNQKHEIPKLQNSPNINWIYSDISDVKIVEQTFTHVFFCATASQPKTGMSEIEYIKNSTITGTQNILSILAKQVNKPRYVNLSSGAVYNLYEGQTAPFSESDIKENCKVETSNSYAHFKLEAERLVNIYTEKGFISGCNIRIFSVSGPLLPLDAHFAFGSFLGQALYKNRIQITGNPQTSRSYVYIAELVYWVLLIATNPTFHDSINLGGRFPLTMEQLAQTFASVLSSCELVFEDSTAFVSNYFPNISYFENHFDVNQEILIEEQIRRHLDWIRNS
jgi:nucleoside-diphosphate-sugar epimerase